MLYFVNDYSEGAHEKVLQHLIDTNMEQLTGYGMDHYCDAAKEKIKKACGCEDAEVFLFTGGTQTNQIVIDTLLQPYEGVVAAQTGHVSTHEAGAIEFTGHKVLELPQTDGKICAADLRELAERFYGDENHEHMVFPGMVYISHPTEYGTLYSRKELEELSAVCKQHGALLAKGRLVGVQFDALFTDDLYKEIGRNAIETAAVLKKGLQEKGYKFLLDSPTNQQFIILEDSKMEELRKEVQFSFWEKADDTHTIIRFATSWATRMEDVQKLLSLL